MTTSPSIAPHYDTLFLLSYINRIPSTSLLRISTTSVNPVNMPSQLDTSVIALIIEHLAVLAPSTALLISRQSYAQSVEAVYRDATLHTKSSVDSFMMGVLDPVGCKRMALRHVRSITLYDGTCLESILAHESSKELLPGLQALIIQIPNERESPHITTLQFTFPNRPFDTCLITIFDARPEPRLAKTAASVVYALIERSFARQFTFDVRTLDVRNSVTILDRMVKLKMLGDRNCLADTLVIERIIFAMVFYRDNEIFEQELLQCAHCRTKLESAIWQQSGQKMKIANEYHINLL